MLKQEVVFENGNNIIKIVCNQINDNKILNCTDSIIQNLKNDKIKEENVLNVSCKTVLNEDKIKNDCVDIRDILHIDCVIFFAKDAQEIYDFNIIATKITKMIKKPVIVAFDGFFAKNQKMKVHIFDKTVNVQQFCNENVLKTDVEKDITEVFKQYKDISGREYKLVDSYLTKDADVLMFSLGSSFEIIKDGVDKLRKNGEKVGGFTVKVLRPLAKSDIFNVCKDAKFLICLDEQEHTKNQNYNISIDVKKCLSQQNTKVTTCIYGFNNTDFYSSDIVKIFNEGFCHLKGENKGTFACHI